MFIGEVIEQTEAMVKRYLNIEALMNNKE